MQRRSFGKRVIGAVLSVCGAVYVPGWALGTDGAKPFSAGRLRREPELMAECSKRGLVPVHFNTGAYAMGERDGWLSADEVRQWEST